jgi:hypothetical protein
MTCQLDEASLALRRLAASERDKVKIYDRAQPTLLLRSPARSTSIVVPPMVELQATEAVFGEQKV